MSNKFVILFQARSGSTLIMSAINRHNDIFCAAEIFNLNEEYRDEFCSKEKNITKREQIKRVFDKGNKKISGFKLDYSQVDSTPGILRILKNDQYKVIHIYRKRILDRMVSLKLAENTNVWSKINWRDGESDYDRLKLILPRYEVINFIRNDQKDVNEYRKLISQFDFFETYYEKFSGDNQSKEIIEIQKFLGVTPEILSPYIDKQNNRKLKDIIVNYDEIKDLEEMEII